MYSLSYISIIAIKWCFSAGRFTRVIWNYNKQTKEIFSLYLCILPKSHKDKASTYTTFGLGDVIWCDPIQPETHKLHQASCRCDATCNPQAYIRMLLQGLLQHDNIKPDASCQQSWYKLISTGLMKLNRLDASCGLQTRCKLTTGFMQVENFTHDASWKQTWSNLRTDLMQVVNRLDAS